MKSFHEFINESSDDDYKGEHSAPDHESGSPIHNLKGTYPDDFYSFHAVRHYGDGVHYDHESVHAIQSAKDRPNKLVKVYRSVPHEPTSQEKLSKHNAEMAYVLKHGKTSDGKHNKSESSKWYDKAVDRRAELEKEDDNHRPSKKINAGDWVSPSRHYAKEHGEAHLNGKYKIISKSVPAKHLFTDGNSVHELGYDPHDKETK